jgi:hypothetical protein
MTKAAEEVREAAIAADPLAARINQFILDEVPSAMRLFPDMWALMLADRLRQAGLVDVTAWTTAIETWTVVVHEIARDRTTHCGKVAADWNVNGSRSAVNCPDCLTAIAETAAPPFRS